MKIKLPAPVAALYQATVELAEMYPGRPFTLDGHLVGSLGEVIVAEALDLTLHPASYPGHDAYDKDGCNVQIKTTAGDAIAFRAICDRLVVVKLNPKKLEAEIIYDGPGAPVWDAAGIKGTNGQRRIGLKKLAGILT